MPKRPNKMAIWYAISAVLLVVLAIIARQQIGLLLLKTIYISIALALGYYADRTIFAAYRPFEMRQASPRFRGFGNFIGSSQA